MTPAPFDGLEVRFLTGSQSLYGDDTLRQVAEQAEAVVRALDEAADVPVRLVAQPVLTTHGTLSADVHLLEKPFTSAELMQALQEQLQARPR